MDTFAGCLSEGLGAGSKEWNGIESSFTMPPRQAEE